MAVDEQTTNEPAPGEGAGAKALGLERWVQFGFIGVALVAFYLLDKLVHLVWDFWAEPDPAIVTGAAAVGGLITGFVLYKHPKVNRFTHDVAGELSKVTWPTRKETWANTVVVVVTSIIAAIIIFLFDMAWSSITDLIYKV